MIIPAHKGKPIRIGSPRDNACNTIAVDVRKLLADHGTTGTFTVLIGEGMDETATEVNPENLSVSDGVLYIKITTDVLFSGKGRLQVTYSVGGVSHESHLYEVYTGDVLAVPTP